MKIHYFQRYHGKENVVTANAMLLLSRLYSYSSDKFFRFLKEYIFPDNFEAELQFTLQEKSNESVPDATISQPSFKVAVETKLYGQFTADQLQRHLKTFSSENYKVLITLDPKELSKKVEKAFTDYLEKYNTDTKQHICHKHLTFERLVHNVKSVLDANDYDMLEVLEDFEEFCYSENLISNDKYRMRMQLAGTTLQFNIENALYYDSIDRGFSAHSYIGLYSQKSVRAIGKITAIITAVKGENGVFDYSAEQGHLTEDMKQLIQKAIEDANNYGYSMDRTRYFFVEKFYQTDFKKVTPRAPMGSRMFDLSQILGVKTLPDTEAIAQALRSKEWM